SLAPPSDLMPPASLTMSTPSFAAATQPTPIWAMLPVVGYSAPLLITGADQPRSGTAPNASAPAPVLMRNSRRVCRFFLLAPATSVTEAPRSFFMSFPFSCRRTLMARVFLLARLYTIGRRCVHAPITFLQNSLSSPHHY